METLNLPSIIMPGEREIQVAVSRINSKVPGFFDKIKEIRVVPGMGGYGYVTNDPKHEGIIFLDLPRIKTTMTSRMTGNSPEALTEAIIKAIYEVVAHEQGHIQDDMKGGELPAEQRAREVVNILGNLCDKFYKLVKSAIWESEKEPSLWHKCKYCGGDKNPYAEEDFTCWECQQKGLDTEEESESADEDEKATLTISQGSFDPKGRPVHIKFFTNRLQKLMTEDAANKILNGKTITVGIGDWNVEDLQHILKSFKNVGFDLSGNIIVRFESKDGTNSAEINLLEILDDTITSDYCPYVKNPNDKVLIKEAMWAGKPSDEWAKCEHCGKPENPYMESPFYCGDYECQQQKRKIEEGKKTKTITSTPATLTIRHGSLDYTGRERRIRDRLSAFELNDAQCDYLLNDKTAEVTVGIDKAWEENNFYNLKTILDVLNHYGFELSGNIEVQYSIVNNDATTPKDFIKHETVNLLDFVGKFWEMEALPNDPYFKDFKLKTPNNPGVIKEAMWAGKPSDEWAKCEHCGKSENPYIESPFYCYECLQQGYNIEDKKTVDIDLSLAPFQGTDYKNESDDRDIFEIIRKSSGLTFSILAGIPLLSEGLCDPTEVKNNLNEYNTVLIGIDPKPDAYDKFDLLINELKRVSLWYSKYKHSGQSDSLFLKNVPIDEIEPITAEITSIYSNL